MSDDLTSYLTPKGIPHVQIAYVGWTLLFPHSSCLLTSRRVLLWWADGQHPSPALMCILFALSRTSSTFETCPILESILQHSRIIKTNSSPSPDLTILFSSSHHGF